MLKVYETCVFCGRSNYKEKQHAPSSQGSTRIGNLYSCPIVLCMSLEWPVHNKGTSNEIGLETNRIRRTTLHAAHGCWTNNPDRLQIPVTRRYGWWGGRQMTFDRYGSTPLLYYAALSGSCMFLAWFSGTQSHAIGGAGNISCQQWGVTPPRGKPP